MNLNNTIDNIYNYIENKKGKVFEIAALILYVTGIIFVICFHEPYFAELQALQIAKSSIHDILFVIPHMEGHPPLWHLILKFASIFTSNPELCVKIPNIIFATLAAWLIIFKSPFSRVVRITLPFTYFIFYQYGVISRPYSMLMFAILFIAYLYPKKNEKPFMYSLSLGLLCFSSGYGIVLAFAITLVWLLEIWNKQNLLSFIKSFPKDKRFYGMLFLLLLCVFIFFELYPIRNEFARNTFYSYPKYQQILYSLFGTIADATFTDIVSVTNIGAVNFLSFSSIISIYCGIGIIFLLCRYFYKKNFLLFILTYILYSAFAGYGYFAPYHAGILTLALIFNFWCSYYQNGKLQKITVEKWLKIAICITLIIQICWSVSSSFLELKYDYAFGKTIATYIKNNNIAHNYKIFGTWWYEDNYYDKDGHSLKPITEITRNKKIIDKIVINDVFSYQPFAILINPYFKDNIIYNFNVFNPECTYTYHSDIPKLSKEEVFARWRAIGTPDIIFATPEDNIVYMERTVCPELKKIKFPWERVYGDELDIRKQYIAIKNLSAGFIWKTHYYDEEIDIYVKKSIFDTAKNWK